MALAFGELTPRGKGLRLQSMAQSVAVENYGISDARVRLIAMHSFNSIFRVDSARAFEMHATRIVDWMA